MSRVSLVRLALPALACLATIAVGQDTGKNGNSTVCEAREAVDRHFSEGDQKIMRCEKESTTTLTLPASKNTSCAASIQIQFFQRNTLAHVMGTLENPTCPASTGEYSVGLRIKDANGEVKTIEFREQWQRADDKPVSIARDYPIGENVDLVGVRTRSLRCACTETP